MSFHHEKIQTFHTLFFPMCSLRVPIGPLPFQAFFTFFFYPSLAPPSNMPIGTNRHVRHGEPRGKWPCLCTLDVPIATNGHVQRAETGPFSCRLRTLNVPMWYVQRHTPTHFETGSGSKDGFVRRGLCEFIDEGI